MKRLTLALTLAGALLLIPSTSFALIDANIMGGYSFQGEVDGISGTQDGFDLGLTAHVNFDLLVFLQFGIGASYDWSNLEWSDDRNQIGLDLYGQVNIPFLPISPYVRFNTAVWDKVSGAIDNTEYFKSYRFGGGILFTVLPIPKVVKLQLFGEYMYSFAKAGSADVKNHTVYLGLRTDFF